MKIDLEVLEKIAKSQSTAKVAVTRPWLRAVLSELKELEEIRAGARLKKSVFGDLLDDIFGKKE